MNTKLREALKARIKDMGLTEKALDELAELGSARLNDTSTDDDISKEVDSLAPFAKAMQAEITRKTQPSNKTSKQSAGKPSTAEGENGEGERGNGENETPAWFKAYQKQTDTQLKKLMDENNALKAETARKMRADAITEKAAQLGIPSYLVKRVSIPEDADIEKELTDFKQELVNNSLLPNTAAPTGDTEASLKADAKSWAESLPDL